MNKQFLKNIRDSMPESLKYITWTLIRNKLINNKDFNFYLNLLENRKELSIEKIKEFQLVQLKQILIHSYQNVPYYQKLFNEISFNPLGFSDFGQMEKIPFLTREIIGENFDKLISTKKVNNGYYKGTTGGSSGLPLKFLLDYDSIYKENAFIYHYRKDHGYKFDDKLVTFRQVDHGDRLWKYNPMHNEVTFFPIKLSKVTISEYANKIKEFNPQFLNGYLSAIWYFAKLLDEYQIKLKCNLKGIFLISENLDINQRNFIEKYFNVESTTFYGHSERCVIAEEIEPYRYQFDPYYGYTEQVYIEKNIYSIVGTGFLNYTMPLIRYKTDDACIPENKLYAIEGKRSSTIGLLGKNNEFLSGTVFDLDKELFKKITTYQFVQREKGKADLLIIVNKHFQPEELTLIRKEIYEDTKGIIDIEVKIVDNLMLSPRGKYQQYVSQMEDGN